MLMYRSRRVNRITVSRRSKNQHNISRSVGAITGSCLRRCDSMAGCIQSSSLSEQNAPTRRSQAHRKQCPCPLSGTQARGLVIHDCPHKHGEEHRKCGWCLLCCTRVLIAYQCSLLEQGSDCRKGAEFVNACNAIGMLHPAALTMEAHHTACTSS